jgi:hypothetical protein
MKRFKSAVLALLCCAFLGICLAGCGDQPSNQPTKDQTPDSVRAKKGDDK